ncbi:hypothetical protein ZWY2020_000745 [Hordeum vulgare]|nr:hypothetical protein ZWY2020_000745 [Hordeum vulgare]
MELFHDGQHVRLRSRGCGRYVLAADDGVSVALSQHGASLDVAWAVHVHHGADGDGPYLLLHSAAYGRYLAATDMPLPREVSHFRIEQRRYDQPEFRPIMWQAIGCGGEEFPNDVLLRNVGGLHLSVRVPGSRIPTMMFYWTVEPVPARDAAPRLPPPLSFGQEEPRARRVIRVVQATAEGIYADERWSQLQFWGRCVSHLRNDLARHLNLPLRLAFAMCVRAGRHGRLTPLVVHLPHGGSGETLDVVVILSGTPAYDALRHPDVDAE